MTTPAATQEKGYGVEDGRIGAGGTLQDALEELDTVTDLVAGSESVDRGVYSLTDPM